MHYERPEIQRLHAYAPGEQPAGGPVVKLNTNENPYPPCPAVLRTIAEVSADMLRRYPPPRAMAFREAAGKAHGLSSDQVIATNGGDELLRMAIGVFCQPAIGVGGTPCAASAPGGVAVEDPTYSLYPVLAEIHGAPVTRIPLMEDWSIAGDFAGKVIDSGCRLAILVNPHAPSARLAPLEQVRQIAMALRGHAVLLIDEAYVDFATGDALPLLAPDSGLDNVLLLRTLSKGYSLAGLRFGYGLGHPDLISALDKARDSYNTDALSQAAAIAALTHRDEARESWRQVIAERQRLAGALEDLGYRVSPSQTNFLLATPPQDAPDARDVYESFKRRGIFVRYFDLDRLRDKLRITVGTRQQNDTLLAALKAMSPAPERP